MNTVIRRDYIDRLVCRSFSESSLAHMGVPPKPLVSAISFRTHALLQEYCKPFFEGTYTLTNPDSTVDLRWCPRQDLNLLQHFPRKQVDYAYDAYFTGCRRLSPDNSNSQLDPLDCSKSVLQCTASTDSLTCKFPRVCGRPSLVDCTVQLCFRHGQCRPATFMTYTRFSAQVINHGKCSNIFRRIVFEPRRCPHCRQY